MRDLPPYKFVVPPARQLGQDMHPRRVVKPDKAVPRYLDPTEDMQLQANMAVANLLALRRQKRSLSADALWTSFKHEHQLADSAEGLLLEHDSDRANQAAHVRCAISNVLLREAEKACVRRIRSGSRDTLPNSTPTPDPLRSSDLRSHLGRDLRKLHGKGRSNIIPGVINATDVNVLHDTGSQVSCITSSLVDELKLTKVPVAPLVLGGLHTSQPSEGRVEVVFSVNGSCHLCYLEVIAGETVDDSIKGRECKVLLGTDIEAAFQIGSAYNVPNRRHGSSIEHLVKSSFAEEGDGHGTSAPRLFHDEDQVSPVTLAELTKATAGALHENSLLSPDSSCSHPDSVVKIPTGDHLPSYVRERPINHAREGPVAEQIEAWKATSVVGPAPLSSPWNSPLLAVAKRDLNGDLSAVRLCLDLRGLNSVTSPVEHPIPLVEDIFRRTRGFKIASSLDLTESYTQFLIAEADRIKTSFRYKGETLMFLRACYGLRNMTAQFQAVIADILHKEGCSDFACNFVDDLIIWSNTAEEHARHVNAVIAALTKHKLRLNVDKTKLGFTKIRLLGHMIDGSSRSLDSRKLRKVLDFPTPTTGKQVQALCGLLNYLRAYVPLHSALGAPFEPLKKQKKISPAEWAGPPAVALQSFRDILSSAPVLSHVDPDRPLVVATDASGLGLGACLYQERLDKKGRDYIAFTSKALSGPRLNYSASKREMLGVMHALVHWRRYLLGRHFRLEGDHQSLSYLLNGKKGNMVIENWLSTILEYSFSFRYVPGPSNIVPDALSRLYPPTVYTVDNPSPPGPVRVRAAATTGSNLQTTLVSDEGEEATSLRSLAKFIKESVGKTLPSSEAQRHELLQEAHAAGHFGARFMLRKVLERGFFWPDLLKDAEQVVSKCHSCLRHNVGKRGWLPSRPDIAAVPLDHISVDLMQLRTTARGYNYVLVGVDVATRFVWLKPLRDKTASSVASALLQIFSDFGSPRVLTSDNGSEFRNELISGLSKLFETKQSFSAPYYPQANGATERHVSTTKAALRRMLEGRVSNWDFFLPAVQAAINSKMHPITRSAPASLMFGRPLYHPDVQEFPPPATGISGDEALAASAPKLSKRWKDIVAHVYPAVFEAASDRRRHAKSSLDARRRIDDEFPQNTVVMARDQARSDSLDPRWLGTYRIVERVGNSYRLLSTSGEILSRIVPHSDLKFVAAPDVTSVETSYEVSAILDHSVVKGQHSYLCSFKGYSEAHNLWLPTSAFDDEFIISEYHRKVDGLTTRKQHQTQLRAARKARSKLNKAAVLATPTVSSSSSSSASSSSTSKRSGRSFRPPARYAT